MMKNKIKTDIDNITQATIRREKIAMWITTTLAIILFFCCVYTIALNKTALFIFGSTIGCLAIIGLVWGVKNLIIEARNEILNNRNQAHK